LGLLSPPPPAADGPAPAGLPASCPPVASLFEEERARFGAFSAAVVGSGAFVSTLRPRNCQCIYHIRHEHSKHILPGLGFPRRLGPVPVGTSAASSRALLCHWVPPALGTHTCLDSITSNICRAPGSGPSSRSRGGFDVVALTIAATALPLPFALRSLPSSQLVPFRHYRCGRRFPL
jgi:hypothetical protein